MAGSRTHPGSLSDSHVIAACKFGMRAFYAGIELSQRDAGTGQAARIRVLGADRAQAPVGIEFVGAPAGGVAGLRGFLL